MPQLTVLSGVGCPPKRLSSKARLRLMREGRLKRRKRVAGFPDGVFRTLKRTRKKSKRRVIRKSKGLGLGFFRCATKSGNVDSSSHRHLSRSQIARHHRINSVMKRFKVSKLKFKATTKRKRRAKKRKIISHISSIGNLYGGLIMKRKKAKRSKGRALAKRYGVRRGKCKKAGKRRVCKNRRGKGYIRKDTKGRKHSSTGKFSLRNIGGFGLASVGAFRADSCAHRVSRAGYGGWRKPRRKGRSKRRSRGLFGLGNIGISMPKVSSVTSMLPSLNIASLRKYGAVVSGMTTPLLLQRFLPKSLTFGWKGLLSYLGLGTITIAVSKRVPFMKSNSDEIAVGVGAGFIFKIFQDIVFKRSLFPAQNIKGLSYLDGVDACVNCSNVGDCSDVGRCLGYSDDEVGNVSDYDETGDYDEISDYDEDEVGAYASYDYDNRGGEDED